MTNHDFICFSLAQIYDLSYIHLHSSPSKVIYIYITNSQCDQLPVGLIAQLFEHCTKISEVIGWNPVQAWIFFLPLVKCYFKHQTIIPIRRELTKTNPYHSKPCIIIAPCYKLFETRCAWISPGHLSLPSEGKRPVKINYFHDLWD